MNTITATKAADIKVGDKFEVNVTNFNAEDFGTMYTVVVTGVEIDGDTVKLAVTAETPKEFSRTALGRNFKADTIINVIS